MFFLFTCSVFWGKYREMEDGFCFRIVSFFIPVWFFGLSAFEFVMKLSQV